jgi:hypothetical protein
MNMGRHSKHWNLYWVESDGIEDCFVVARNSRSACSVESRENGFEIDFAAATKVIRIPKGVENSYKRQEEYKKRKWPGYVYGKKFFEDLGAKFRTNEKQQEMLLCDVVYAVDDYVPCEIYRKRSIGSKALVEIEREIPDPKHDDEDIWHGPVIHLITGH